MSNPAEFIQLKIQNDWGTDHFFLPEDSAEGHRIDKSAALSFKKGQKVTVMWPNGEIEKVRLRIKDIERNVYDMGHDYKARSQMPVFDVSVKGLGLEVRLVDVMIQRSDCKKAVGN